MRTKWSKNLNILVEYQAYVKGKTKWTLLFFLSSPNKTLLNAGSVLKIVNKYLIHFLAEQNKG